MGKKDKNASTIENRVYLFKDLAAAFLSEHGAMLGAGGAEAQRARRALAEIARVSCIVADTEGLTAQEVAESIAGPAEPAPAKRPSGRATANRPSGQATTRKKAAKKRGAKKRRGWGGGHGGG